MPDAGEECDDGNHLSHDGCSSGCTDETMQWVQVFPSPVPPRRGLHGLAYYPPDQRVVTFAGTNGTYLGDTWTLNRDPAWSFVAVTAHPSGMHSFGMVYDELRSRLLLFGGKGPGTMNWRNQTWEFDGTDWTLLSPNSSPPGRGGMSMTYDSGRDRVVFYGGEDYTQGWGETWEFDGTDWVNRIGNPRPLYGMDTALVYDSARGRCVLHGGGPTWDANGTWEWDGFSWTNLNPAIASPPPYRLSPALAYDEDRQVVVMFGGNDGTNQLNDTWEYNGFTYTWTQVTTTTTPPARTSHRLTYDSDRKRIVMFGGATGVLSLDDTWEYRWQSAWPEEDCGNSSDDDGDNLADCADPDCAGVTGC